MILSVAGNTPVLPEDAFVAENATVAGDVTLGSGVSVWFGAVIRGDVDSIRISDGTNVQDCAVLHVDAGSPLTVGCDVTVGHAAVLHGCTIGDGTLVGIRSVILNGAKIGKNCLIGANALVTENKVIPDGSLVVGSPGKILRSLTREEIDGIVMNARHYVELSSQYKRGLAKIR
jgi:carbonic anhydrase/acetyltransferase-like protein (isoleucine patch superfamily)